MSTNKKGKYEKQLQTQTPAKKKHRKKKKKPIKLTPMQKKVLCYILAIILLITIPMAIQHSHDTKKHEAEIAELTASYEAQLEELRMAHEQEIFNLQQEHEYGGNVSEIEKEAEYICKVVYGMTRSGHDINDQKAIVWCILNRVDSVGYPDTVQGVCEQPKQWIGYNADNPVMDSTYDMVLEILKVWHNDGHRPMGKEFVFLNWSSEEILLRDTFEEGKSTRYWRIY